MTTETDMIAATETVVAAQPMSPPSGRTRRGERGEGIISTAIAVLIVAALGVVAYGAFDALFDSANDRAATEIEQIGR